jgi:hypothetical protein
VRTFSSRLGCTCFSLASNSLRRAYSRAGRWSIGKERADVSDQVDRLDQFLALATCLRDKGYDVDDPTAETLGQWMGDFKEVFDWKDPAAEKAYQECSSAD